MSSALHRPVCDLLGCTHPVVLAGMGGVARSELVGAVTRAGGFGFLGMVREPVALIRTEVQRLRAWGVERFGVNIIPAATDATLLEAQVAACLELRVPVVGLFWDLPIPVMRRFRAAGVTIVYQVGSVVEALSAQEAGAHVLIAQGVEAGGHVRGAQPLLSLLPEVVAATDLPVLAAGGIVDGADLATVLALGAQGAVIGTALIATPESFAHPYHKQRLVEARDGETVLTDAFHINWPAGAKVRVLSNSVTRGNRGDPHCGASTVIGEEDGRPIYLFSTDSPLRSMTGDLEAMALYAGAGVGRVKKVVRTAARLRAIVAAATTMVDAGVPPPGEMHQFASPACLAHEVDDHYMGYVSREELLASLNELLEAARASAAITGRSAGTTPDATLNGLIRDLHREHVRWCGVLTSAIYALAGAPSRLISSMYRQAMMIREVPRRLAVINQGQEWVVRRARNLLPRIGDDFLSAKLTVMLTAYQQTIGRIEAYLPPSERHQSVQTQP